jgi:hypothetical protein
MGEQLLVLLLAVSWFRSGWNGALSLVLLGKHSPFWKDHLRGAFSNNQFRL